MPGWPARRQTYTPHFAGWLSGYTYRMDMPVANPSTTGDRQLIVPFPAYFLAVYPGGAKCLANYHDVHVTTSDGLTELPCSMDAGGKNLTIDYRSMPAGLTKLYIYYGNAVAPAPTAPTLGAGTYAVQAVNPNGEIQQGSPSTPIDYIWGTDNDAVFLDSLQPNVYLAATSPHQVGIASNADTFHYLIKPGQWMIRKGGTINAAKLHLYLGSANYGMAGTLNIHRFANAGSDSPLVGERHDSWNINGWTCDDTKSMPTWNNRYYSVESGDVNEPWTTAWVWDSFTDANGTSLHSHTSDSSYGWTLHPVGATDGAQIQNNKLISNSTSICAYYHTYTPPTANYAVQMDYIYHTNNTMVTYLCARLDTTNFNCYRAWYNGTQWELQSVWNNGSNSSVIGTSAATLTAGTTYTLILEVIGTTINLFVNGVQVITGVDANVSAVGRAGVMTAVATSSSTTGFEHDNFRVTPLTAAGAFATAGAAGLSQLDQTPVTLALTSGFTTGYKAISLTPQWITDWQGDYYSNGLLIKDSTDTAGASNRYASIDVPTGTNPPVFEIDYASLPAAQLTQRKLTTDTYYASTFEVANRYLVEPSASSFGIMGVINAERKWDLFYIEAGGRIRRMLQNAAPASGVFGESSPGWGLSYDPVTGRTWVGGNWGASLVFTLGYSPPYIIDSLTWNTSSGTAPAFKGSFLASNDVVYCLVPASNSSGGTGTRATDIVNFYTFTRGTATWSGATSIMNCACTDSTLSGNMTNSQTTIPVNNCSNYPAFGSVIIDNEIIWFTGNPGGGAGNLTGAIRGAHNTTPATHSSGATVYNDQIQPDYCAMSYDGTNNLIRCFAVINSAAGVGGVGGYTDLPNLHGIGSFSYNKVIQFQYSLTRSRWEDVNGSALTLPMQYTTWPVVSRSNFPAYGENILALNDGNCLISFGEYATSGYNPDGAMITALSSGTWTPVSLGISADQISLVQRPAFIRASCIQPLATISEFSSVNDGASWSGPTTLCTHSFSAPTTQGNWEYALWNSDSTEKGNLGAGAALVYYQHFCSHGAVYLTTS